jgi:predicted metalloprotease with PDZ domain
MGLGVFYDRCMKKIIALPCLVCALALGGLTARAQPQAVFGEAALSPDTPAIPAPQDVAYPGTIELQVDATNTAQRIVRVTQRMPVTAGPLVLFYPKWLPGNHGPTGDVAQLAGLRINAGGKNLPWVRDVFDPQAFHVTVPAGVNQLELQFEHLAAIGENNGRNTLTARMLNLQWNATLLYPAGHHAHQIRFAAKLKLPEGWQAGTGLREHSKATQPDAGNWISYAPTSLETLVDSPVFAGAHTQRLRLDDNSAQPVSIFVMADEPSQLQASDAQWAAHKKLVAQSDKLFGARHFRQYDFLLALSDVMGGIGLEHHESSENGVRPGYFKDWKLDEQGNNTGGVGSRELLPHEYVHSWNGKYRRPADLLTPNFNFAMRNSLLWVYEGQTQYWGRLLTARSNLASATQTLAIMARVAANAQARSGRLWRNLQDTTNEGTINSRRSSAWRDHTRSADYYDEATLIWLDADTLIREKTGEKKSLDDFARAFFGQPSHRYADGSIAPRAYNFAEVVKTLNDVAPHDWATFLRDRLDSNSSPNLLDGIARAGYQLVFKPEASDVEKASNEQWRSTDFSFSLGLTVQSDGKLWSVNWTGPAAQAGLSTAHTIVAVNGLAFKPERLREAIAANTGGKAPIELIVKDGEIFQAVRMDYRDGLRHPHLERVASTPDRFSAILKAR